MEDSFDWLEAGAGSSSGNSAPVHAFELDWMLWRGFHHRALPRLEAMLERAPPQERAAAGWVLARWHLAQEDFGKAHRAILVFGDYPEAAKIILHQGPTLLGVQICCACGDVSGAQSILQAGIKRFGPIPDIVLAEMVLAKARGASDAALSEILKNLHREAGLACVSLATGTSARFDRLEANPTHNNPEPARGVPLVSVIIPVFNGEEVLPTALRSLRMQSWSNLEIIVVDDGSTDQTVMIAQAEAVRDPRIKLFTSASNQGAYAARNLGFCKATGDFITVHDADDWSHPQKIELQVRALLDDNALQASVSHWARVSNDLEMTAWRIDQGWVYRNVSSLMVRASQRDQLGYWDRAKVNADTEYYYRIIHSFGAQAIQEVLPGVPLAFGRTLPASLTTEGTTHLRTQFSGLRNDYMEAAHIWHWSAKEVKDLYLSQHPPVRPFRAPVEIAIDKEMPPKNDYDLLKASDLLDEEWYLLSNPDVMQSDLGAARHYLVSGAAENRDPGPLFSTGGYRRANGLDPSENPLLHWLKRPQDEAGECLPTFKGKLWEPSPNTQHVLVFAHTSGETLFGAERSLLDVISRLGREGLQPVVVLPSMRNADYLNKLLDISAAVEALPQAWRNSLNPPCEKTIQAAQQLIQKYQPVEVHVNTLVLEAPLIAARAEGVPSLVYVRELPAEDRALCRSLQLGAGTLRMNLLTQADQFIVPSQIVADWLGCSSRCTIRPNAVDEELFELPFAPGPVLKIALISSNTAKKGIKDAIDAARIVAETGWPVHFLLIGPKTADLDRLHPLPPNVGLRSYTASPAEAVMQADIILSLSHFSESFGRTVVEAMAAGRPVICYDRGAPPSLVVSGQTGFVVPADSPQSVANAVLALDAARLQLNRMSIAARKRAREIQSQALA